MTNSGAGPLSSRVGVVTGASAGIGEAIARDLSARGASVVVNARRTDRLEALVKELGPERTAAVPGDAADQSVIDRMLDVAKERFGGGTREADLVVANAGRGLRGGVYDSDPAQWEEIFRINLLGVARLLRAAAERMAGPVPVVQGAPPGGGVAGSGGGGGSGGARPPADWPTRARDIIVLGSTVGRHVSPFSSLYGSAKAGAHMLAESLRRTMGPRGVRITLIEPGVVRSEFQGVARYDPASFGAFMDSIGPVLSPEDIARVVTFVASQPAGVHVNDIMIRPTRQEYP